MRWRPGRLVRNSAFSLYWQLARAMVLAVYLVLLTRGLGTASYGLLSSPLTLGVVFGGLSGGGAGLMLLRDGARAPSDLTQAWSRFFSASLYSMPACFALYGAAIYALVPSLLSARLWVPIGIAEIVFIPFTNAAAFTFQSAERLGWAGAAMAMPGIARLACAATLIASRPAHPLEFYAVLHLAGAVLAFALVTLALRRRFAVSWRLTRLSAAWWLDCLGFSAMYFVANASADLDKSLVLRNSNPVIAGLYNAGYRIMSVLAQPAIALVQAMLPRLFSKDGESLRRRAGLITAAACAIFFYSSVAAVVLRQVGGLLIALLGKGYEALAPLMPLLGVLLVIFSLRMVPSALLFASGRPAVRAAIEGSAIAILFAASSVLVPRFGLEGAALTAIISETWIFIVGWIMVAMLLRSGPRPPGRQGQPPGATAATAQSRYRDSVP